MPGTALSMQGTAVSIPGHARNSSELSMLRNSSQHAMNSMSMPGTAVSISRTVLSMPKFLASYTTWSLSTNSTLHHGARGDGGGGPGGVLEISTYYLLLEL
jgi:hypothetical protein